MCVCVCCSIARDRRATQPSRAPTPSVPSRAWRPMCLDAARRTAQRTLQLARIAWSVPVSMHRGRSESALGKTGRRAPSGARFPRCISSSLRKTIGRPAPWWVGWSPTRPPKAMRGILWTGAYQVVNNPYRGVLLGNKLLYQVSADKAAAARHKRRCRHRSFLLVSEF